MKIPPSNAARFKYYALLLLFCLIYWVIDSFWSYLSFERNLHTLMYTEPGSLVDTLMLRVSPYQFVSRMVVITLFVVAGMVLFEVLATKNRAEAAFRDSEAKYSTLINNASEAIFVSQGQRLKFVNPRASLLAEMSVEEMTDQPIARFIHPDDQDFMRRYIAQQPAAGSARKCTFRLVNNKNKTIWVRLNTTPIKWQNEFATLNFLNDISEEKRLAEQLQRSEKMETVGMLAGGVAHDLNNILSGLVSYPDLLLLDLPQGSPLREPILTMRKSGERAALIVQDLLTLARRNVPTMQAVQLNSVIQEYLSSLEFTRLKGFNPEIRVLTDLAPDLPHIQGSLVHLSKTVMNLVTNAVEACHQVGTITVSTSNRYLNHPAEGYETIKAGDYVVLEVKDTGEGIYPEDIQRIFEPFYTKKVMGKSGTGLGMAVVWGTVKDHRGYIDLKSEPQKGTRIFIYFPVTREALVHPADQPASEWKGQGQQILIVDDIEEQRSIGTLLLSKLGYQTHAAASGEEAVSFLKTHSVDLVILDMIMAPGMDGLDTYKEILKIHPGQKTIIASGFAETDRVKQMQELGAGPYLKKPYSLAEIGQCVKTALSA